MSTRLLVAGTAALSLLITGCEPDHPSAREAAASGKAIHDSIDWAASDEADTVLLLSRANAHLIASGTHNAHDELRRQLDHLIALRIEGQNGSWGWGQAFPWDAYGDGVVNPLDTIYSYTTAAAALAFLDGHAVLEDEKYVRAAEKAASALLTDTCCWRQGDYISVWYDDQPNDQRDERQVHNVNALALAALTRLSQVSSEDYSQWISAMARHLIDDQGAGYEQESYEDTPVSEANWRYSRGEPARPNDLIHEAFIVEGLLTYGSEDAVAAALRSLDGIKSSHFREDGSPRDGPYTWGSLGWGPGAGLFVLSMSTKHRDAARGVADNIMRSVASGDHSFLPEEPRARAWYALALARYAHEGELTASPL